MLGSFAQQIPSGPSPFTAQGTGPFPGAFPPQALAANPFGNYAPSQSNAYGTPFAQQQQQQQQPQQPLQQLVQSLLLVPQQLQHLLQLTQVQQQQIQYLLQSIPQQIQQLQQLLHQPAFQSSTPQQSWGSSQAPFGIPQAFGAQSAHVM